MLVRVRRYRVFLLAVILTVLGLYYLADSHGWPARLSSYTPSSVAGGSNRFSTYNDPEPDEQPVDGPDGQTTEHLHTPVLQEQSDADTSIPKINLPGPHHIKEPYELPEPFAKSDTPPKIRPASPAKLPLAKGPKFDEDRITPVTSAEPSSSSPASSAIHWSSQAQKYPVSSTIQLPTGKQTPIPRVQAAFGNEDPASQTTREKRQAAVKAAMKKHWAGYKAFAWGHDELKPISEDHSDPFAGWGATLVDSLDTLWIMGMKDEFEEAVKATGNIDFTTTELKRELPLFEVTIRYLGGLLAAYDLSAAKYPILLEKAIELGEILYGAFDTENRMPITYYKWQPENVRRFHRASTSVVLAEIGTLSMEFTRLAQLSKEPKYYDAIARITNAFYDFQNKTSLPGMWPQFVDASGCSYKSSQSSFAKSAEKYGYTKTNWGGALPKKPDSPPASGPGSDRPTVPDSLGHLGDPKAKEVEAGLDKRANDDEDDDDDGDEKSNTAESPKCGATVLKSSSASVSTYTLGGMADSVYEYLPKEYLLLGVGNGQYREMHENAMTPIKEYTLYRPMIEDEKRNIRFTGKYVTIGAGITDADGRATGTLDTSTGHLACFAGGMVGLGAKIFNRPDEMELAEQLTDGCVWAYEITATGIMAEDIYPVACDSMQSCKWNETKWHELVDPYAEEQLQLEWQDYDQQVKDLASSKPSSAEDARKALLEPLPLPIPEKQFADLDRRQLNEQALEEFTGSAEDVAVDTIPAKSKKPGSRPVSSVAPEPSSALPEKPMSLAEHMAFKVKSDRLAPGISRWGGRNYILRPEAIESVFYMYRITGDKKWQDKGWKMWQAIDKHTSVDNGNSAIADVTTVPAIHMDKAESFWTGETLKYFYLLYSEPGLVSLDDYVL